MRRQYAKKSIEKGESACVVKPRVGRIKRATDWCSSTVVPVVVDIRHGGRVVDVGLRRAEVVGCGVAVGRTVNTRSSSGNDGETQAVLTGALLARTAVCYKRVTAFEC